jgi:hypothetical protein
MWGLEGGKGELPPVVVAASTISWNTRNPSGRSRKRPRPTSHIPYHYPETSTRYHVDRRFKQSIQEEKPDKHDFVNCDLIIIII